MWLALCQFQQHAECARRFTGAARDDDQRGRVRRMTQQVRDRLDRGGVSPLEIVNHQDKWPALPELLEQRADRAVVAEPLAGGPRGEHGRAAQRREHPVEVGKLVRQPSCLGRGQHRDLAIEGLHEWGERHLALELGCSTAEAPELPLRGLGHDCLEQTCLTDAGLARDHEDARLALLDSVEQFAYVTKLGLPADQ